MEQIGIIIGCMLFYLTGSIIAGVLFTCITKLKVTTIFEVDDNDGVKLFVGFILLLSWISVSIVFITYTICFVFKNVGKYVLIIIGRIEDIILRTSK